MTAPVAPAGGTRTVAPGDPLVEIAGLTKAFPIRGGLLQKKVAEVRAVDGVDLVIRKGETLGLVGESGCGKTTLGRLVLRLIEPSSGTITFAGQDITKLHGTDLRPFRRRMQIIFQDPYASLDPRTPIADSIGEGLRIHNLGTPKEREAKVAKMMDMVGLQPYHASRYPHEFSGGQRQRIGIARALVLEPELIVCDEPVSALDVSIQAQVLNLLKQLQRELGLTYLFVAHNLGVVEHISDRVAVMYLGRVAELASREPIYRDPRHPYTMALMSAIPVPDPTRRIKRIILTGDVPSPVNPPSGCSFHPRCWLRARLDEPKECSEVIPPLNPVAGDHVVGCHFFDRSTAERDRLTGAGDGVIVAPVPSDAPADAVAAANAQAADGVAVDSAVIPSPAGSPTSSAKPAQEP
jgi:peptide/nickel transport system ATP-binding protein/oligopeptide transport system ATP-binding protein